jgi:hypothetical protein
MSVTAPRQISKRAYRLKEMKAEGDGSLSFLYGEINAGRLRARKLGRHTIVLAEDREAWLQGLPSYQPQHENAA